MNWRRARRMCLIWASHFLGLRGSAQHVNGSIGFANEAGASRESTPFVTRNDDEPKNGLRRKSRELSASMLVRQPDIGYDDRSR